MAAANKTCSTIAFTRGTAITIFLGVNLPLGTAIADCTGKFVEGDAYCALLFVVWDEVWGGRSVHMSYYVESITQRTYTAPWVTVNPPLLCNKYKHLVMCAMN